MKEDVLPRQLLFLKLHEKRKIRNKTDLDIRPESMFDKQNIKYKGMNSNSQQPTENNRAV